jgi:hypothetical protein
MGIVVTPTPNNKSKALDATARTRFVIPRMCTILLLRIVVVGVVAADVAMLHAVLVPFVVVVRIKAS